MSLRLIEVYLDAEKAGALGRLLENAPIIGMWQEVLSDGIAVKRILMPAEGTDEVLGLIEDRHGSDEGFRMIILPVEATTPRPPEPEETEQEQAKKKKESERVSIEEIYQKLSGECACKREFLVMIVIASIVAGLGLVHNDIAVVIGSMVIAPLLGPNMALSMATALGDTGLAKRSGMAIGVGTVVALLFGITMGFVLDVDPSFGELAARADVRHYYILLAFATGVAGSYSLTTGVSQALVGVMVAVALLPPLVATGLFLGAGLWADASGAFLLFLVNIVCVNLAGVVTFVAQGIRPRKWWEAEKAKKGIKSALIMWASLLVLLAALIYIAQRLRHGLP